MTSLLQSAIDSIVMYLQVHGDKEGDGICLRIWRRTRAGTGQEATHSQGVFRIYKI